jgi:hypothetical protein
MADTHTHTHAKRKLGRLLPAATCRLGKHFPLLFLFCNYLLWNGFCCYCLVFCLVLFLAVTLIIIWHFLATVPFKNKTKLNFQPNLETKQKTTSL